MILLVVATILFAQVSSRGFAESPDRGNTAIRLSQGFDSFLSTLDEAQRDAAVYAFDDDERLDLRLAPLGLEGLRVDEMSDAQWSELESLLGSVLSPAGLSKLNTIRSLELEVAETEGGLFGFLTQWMRSAQRYFLSVYGEPRTKSAWGLRFDGHHLSLNWTIVPEAPISVTPVFWGGQPRVVPEGFERTGLRVLADEEDRGIALVNGLGSQERSAARLSFFSGSGIRRPMSIAGEVPLVPNAPFGIARRDLDPQGRARFDAIIEVQLENYNAEIASRYRARIAEDVDSLRFAYAVPDEFAAGPLVAGTPLYYRVQGSRLVIEFDNTSDEADHIHVVWRDLEDDFGLDLLAEHWMAEHAHQGER